MVGYILLVVVPSSYRTKLTDRYDMTIQFVLSATFSFYLNYNLRY